MTDNYKINDSRYCHKLTVATLVFMIALGFGSLGGGTAFAQQTIHSVTVNPGDDIKWTWAFSAGKRYGVKIRYWAKTIDSSAVAGTHYKQINGYMYIERGQNSFSVQTETYENDDATSEKYFKVELVNPQYDNGSVWVNIDHTVDIKFPQRWDGGGSILYSDSTSDSTDN